MSSEQYVKEVIQNFEWSLVKQNWHLKKYKQPFSNDYYPELDTSPLLEDEETNYYQSQISILRWMVELGRLDIYINVALLSSFLAQPRRGHMEAIYNIYGYLKHHNSYALPRLTQRSRFICETFAGCFIASFNAKAIVLT